MTFKRISIAALSLIALIGVGAATYVSQVLLDPEHMKPLLIEKVQLATGRTLTIGGDFSHSLSLSPTLTVTNIQLSNAAWGKAEQLVQADSLKVTFALLPLLSGAVEIASLEIDGAQIWLEQQGSAQNWQMLAPSAIIEAQPAAPSGEPAPAQETIPESAEIPASNEQGGFFISQLRLSNAQLHYHDLSLEVRHQIAIDTLTLSNLSAQTIEQFTLKAAYKNAQIEASGSLAQQVLQLKLKAQTEQSTAQIDGSVSLADWVFDTTLALESQRLGDVLALTGGDGTAQAPLNLKATLGGTRQLISFSSLDATYDGQHFSGSGKLDLSKDIPYLSGALTFKALDLRSADAHVQPAAQATPTSPPSEVSVGILPRTPLPFEALTSIDAALAITAESIMLGDVTLSNVAAQLALEKGVLTIKDSIATMAEGSLSASLRADATSSPPAVTLEVSSKRLALGALFPDLDEGAKLEGGNTNATLSLRGQGLSLHDIASNAQGHYDMLIEGTRYTPAARLHTITSFLNILRGSSSSQGKPVEVTCGIAQFDIANGIATSKTLLVQSPAAIISGEGTLNLGDETLRMQMRARSLLLGLADVTPALILSGSWLDPSVSLSAEQTLLNLGKMALGAVTGVGLIAVVGEQFTDRLGITADNNPCLKSLQNAAEAAAKADANPKATAKQAEDNLRAVRDEVKGSASKVEEDIKSLRDGLKGLLKKE